MVSHASRSAASLLGVPEDDLTGGAFRDLIRLADTHGRPVRDPDDQLLETRAPVEIGRSYDVWLERADGNRSTVAVGVTPVAGLQDVMVRMQDIGGLPLYDPLTRFPRQALFAERVNEAVSLTADGGGAAVLLLALDRFDAVRESLGRQAEEIVVAGVADRLRSPATRRWSISGGSEPPSSRSTVLVGGMSTQPRDAAIVAGVTRLAQALALTVVAERVETEDQLASLRVLGCDLAQGYRWTEPLPAADFETGGRPTTRHGEGKMGVRHSDGQLRAGGRIGDRKASARGGDDQPAEWPSSSPLTRRRGATRASG